MKDTDLYAELLADAAAEQNAQLNRRLLGLPEPARPAPAPDAYEQLIAHVAGCDECVPYCGHCETGLNCGDFCLEHNRIGRETNAPGIQVREDEVPDPRDAELAQLRAIVEQLAGCQGPGDVLADAGDPCPLCWSQVVYDTSLLPSKWKQPEAWHDPNCPWVAARRYVEEVGR